MNCIFIEIGWCNRFKDACNHNCPKSEYYRKMEGIGRQDGSDVKHMIAEV